MNPHKEILIFEDSHSLTNHLIKQWCRIAQQAIADQGLFNAALSGGHTPMEFYSQLPLCEEFRLLWPKTHIFLGDERFVPWDDEGSNFRMIKANLLDRVPIPAHNVHPIRTHQESVAIAADEFKDDLMYHFACQKKRLPRFDLILLGVGEDGHTASLFPEMHLTQDESTLTQAVSLPRIKNERVSLTLPVINNASHVIFLILGARKAAIAKKIIDENFSCPASLIQPLRQGRLIYLLDKEAAQGLSPS